MFWSQDELATLRATSVLHLKRYGLISDNEVMKETLFTCDSCKDSDDCEWSFHYENIHGYCTKKEVTDEEE